MDVGGVSAPSGKVDWHLAELVDNADDDPFANAGPVAVEQIGLRIDLRDSPEVLEQRLRDLIESEAALWRRGVTCEMKSRPDASCSACPLSRHDDPQHVLFKLCRVGRDQESTLMQMYAATLEEAADASERVAA